jgi:hypothetical protein
MNFSNLLENNISNDVSPLSSYNENFRNYEDFDNLSEIKQGNCATCPSQVDPSSQIKKLFQDTQAKPNSKSPVSELMNKTGLNANSEVSNHPLMCNCAPCSNSSSGSSSNTTNSPQVPSQIAAAVKSVVSNPEFVKVLNSLESEAKAKGLNPDVVKSLQINPTESVENIGNKIDQIGKVATQIGMSSEFVKLRKEFSNAIMAAGEAIVAAEAKAKTNVIPGFAANMMNMNMNNMNMNNNTSSHSSGSNTIFVDLPCYMSKMNNLSAHSDNMMVDLSLLTSNLKSCSYIKKAPTPIEQANLMPQQDMIKVANIPAKVLVTSNSPNKADNNLVVGLTKETFDMLNDTLNNITYGWWETFYVKLIVLLLILYVIMYKK